MKTKLYMNTTNLIAGTTLKDNSAPEENNMALHACIDSHSILENRRELAAYLKCERKDFVCANQTHSANVHKVTRSDKGLGALQNDTAIPNVDALYTEEPGIVLCSFTADCVPVIFYNEVNGIIGVIHSGWQGTVKEITPKVFEHLAQNEHSNPADWHVQIGMALSQEKFEVDEDVYLKFKALGYADDYMYFNEMTDKYHIDNQLTVKRQCERAGIPSGQIFIDPTCTFSSDEGFSYRQDRQAGRHLSFILKR